MKRFGKNGKSCGRFSLFATAAVALGAFGEVVDMTAVVRADGQADGKSCFSVDGSSSGSQSHEDPKKLFNGILGSGTDERYYMTRPTVCYALADDWRPGKKMVLKKYVIDVSGSSYDKRIPCAWTLKASIDGGITYTAVVDSRSITMASPEIAPSSGRYLVTVELPENAVASRFFKFEFTASMTSTGAADGAITMGEIQLWGEFADAVNEIAYDVSSVTAVYDGQAHAPKVNAVFPLDVAVEYAASEAGPYSATPMSRREVGESEVWMRFSRDGYDTVVVRRTVTITNGVTHLTKAIREYEAADGVVRHSVASSSLPTGAGAVANLFNGAVGGDSDRWYGGTWFSYSLDDGFLEGDQVTLVRYVLKNGTSSTKASSRCPTGWDLYGSADGATYDLLLDTKDGLTIGDFAQTGGAYVYAVDLPGNTVPFRHYKFVVRPGGSVNLNEVELYARIEPERQIIVYGKRGRHVGYSGIPVSIEVTVNSPAEGTSVEYAFSADGPWSAERPLFVDPTPETAVWFRLSAAGCDTVLDSATVAIDPLPKGEVDLTALLRKARLDTGTPVYSASGTVGESDPSKPAYADALFDGVTGDSLSGRWYVNSSNAFAVYSVTNAYAPGRTLRLSRYQIEVGGNSWDVRRPPKWTLYGSRDGVKYTPVDHVENADWGASRTFDRALAGSARCRHLKIVFEALGQGGAITPCEIRFFGEVVRQPMVRVLVR